MSRAKQMALRLCLLSVWLVQWQQHPLRISKRLQADRNCFQTMFVSKLQSQVKITAAQYISSKRLSIFFHPWLHLKLRTMAALGGEWMNLVSLACTPYLIK